MHPCFHIYSPVINEWNPCLVIKFGAFNEFLTNSNFPKYGINKSFLNFCLVYIHLARLKTIEYDAENLMNDIQNSRTNQVED